MTEKCRAAVDYFFSMLSDDLVPLARMQVEFLSETSKSERLKERQQRRYDTIRQFLQWLLAEAQKRGDVRADADLEASAELMMALHEGIVLLSVSGMRRVSLEQLKSAYVSLLNAGLASPDGALLSYSQVRNGTHHSGGL
jgi:hypothetical protein